MRYSRMSKSTGYLEYHKISKLNKKYNTDLVACFVKADRITFTYTECRKNTKPTFRQKDSYTFKIITRKNGTHSFQFYKHVARVAKYCNPYKLESILKHRVKNTVQSRAFDTITSAFYVPKTITVDGPTKAAEVRLRKILFKFLKSHNVSRKYLSKNPIELMFQLVNPALAELPIDKKRLISTSALFKRPIWKSVLNTNGKLSKKLLLQILDKYPANAGQIFVLAKVIKNTYGLDKSQHYLNGVLDKKINLLHFSSSAVKEYSKLIKCFGFDKFCANINVPHHTMIDTMRMLKRTNVVPEYESITDLHDKLSVEFRKAPTKHKESDLLPVHDLINKLQSEWTLNNYTLDIPTKVGDLRSYSLLMNNCVSSYISKVMAGYYFIVGVKRNDDLIANIGITIKSESIFGPKTPSLDQWSGPRNASLPQNLIDVFTPILKQAGIRV